MNTNLQASVRNKWRLLHGRLACCLTLYLAIIGVTFSNTGNAATATIAVASNFSAAAKQLRTEFNKHSEHTIKLSFGSTGKLYAQIMHGAPFDALLSADQARPNNLLANGLAVTGSEFTYAVGQLILYSNNETYDLSNGTLLKSPKLKRIAIANPKTAPYGAAALETLQALGVKSVLESKLIQGNSIAQTFQFSFTGNADVGFIALSQVVDRPKANFWLVPQTLYSPLQQGAVLLTRGKNNKAAQEFLLFLNSTQAKEMIKNFGYQ